MNIWIKKNKKQTKTLWKKMESKDYVVEKKKDKIMKLMWRDWEKGEAKVTASHCSSRRLSAQKNVVTHWPLMKYWNWLRGYCGLDYTRWCTKLPNEPNKVPMTLYLPQVTNMQQRKSPELFAVKNLAKYKIQEGSVNIKEARCSSEIIWEKKRYFFCR